MPTARSVPLLKLAGNKPSPRTTPIFCEMPFPHIFPVLATARKIEAMIGSARKELLRCLSIIGSMDPKAWEIPRRRVEATLAENVPSPFQAEPIHLVFGGQKLIRGGITGASDCDHSGPIRIHV